MTSVPDTSAGGKAPPPCRLNFILARNAPVGVIFRRGPTAWVRIIRWDTCTDVFDRGQWFHGRIYDERCDLSPDGTKLVYFATKQWRWRDPEVGATWTAISRPPYLTALALWRNMGTWGGGGLFDSDRQVWLNSPEKLVGSIPNRVPKSVRVIAGGWVTDTVVLFRRLQRDGWAPRSKSKLSLIERLMPQLLAWTGPHTLEKLYPGYPIRLVMTAQTNRMPGTYEFALTTRDSKTEEPFDAAWADWDQNGRLVYVQRGKLFARIVDPAGKHEPVELADFNEEKPEAILPPEWATRW